jgi:hypothetical protein
MDQANDMMRELHQSGTSLIRAILVLLRIESPNLRLI